MFFRSDCRHFLGHVPCRPHKDHGYHCTDCPAYARTSKRILIIQLGAMGDVIRTTPLVTRFRALYPDARIAWITHFPDILPRSHVDEILPLDVATRPFFLKKPTGRAVKWAERTLDLAARVALKGHRLRIRAEKAA